VIDRREDLRCPDIEIDQPPPGLRVYRCCPSRSQLARYPIPLLPGIGDRLVGLGLLLRPLIELHWMQDVANWSKLETEDERLRARLRRWTARAADRRKDLRNLAASNRRESNPPRARGLLTSTYSHIAPGTPLWVHGKDFDYATGPIELG